PRRWWRWWSWWCRRRPDPRPFSRFRGRQRRTSSKRMMPGGVRERIALVSAGGFQVWRRSGDWKAPLPLLAAVPSTCSRSARQPARLLAEILPRVGHVAQAVQQVADREAARAHLGAQLLPRQRRRDRGLGTRACGIGSDRRGAAAVAQV